MSCRRDYWHWAGSDHNARTRARAQQLTMLQANNMTDCLARGAELGFTEWLSNYKYENQSGNKDKTPNTTT